MLPWILIGVISVAAVLIYVLFIRKAQEKSHIAKNIYLKSLDMTYTPPSQRVSLFSYDPVSSSNDLRRNVAEQKRHMEYLAGLEFYLEYQPQVTPHNQKFVGAEALLRARNLNGEVVMPYVFLPWLEAADMIRSLDLWVAAEVIKQDAIWQAAGVDVEIKMNVSSETLLDKQSTHLLIDKIAEAGGRVSVEILEQDFSTALDDVVSAIKKIQAFGGKVYIDDFGTGYSSLSYLNSLKVDCIKIDRSFVLALQTLEGEKVMAGIFNFAEALGLSLVIEGVETEAQLNKLPKNIPFAVQGWLYSKAIPADEIPEFAKKFTGV